jgi:tRNA uridine 5-carboxymethylaminomethyl modification enzyme
MDFEALVIGGGHAGIEASLALARLGHRTLLVTQNPDAIGRLSCNPAIGGLAKGNLVREIDALGGEMGLMTDESLIQFRILNRSRGPAVQAPRAQTDKARYSSIARRRLESCAGLSILMDTVVDLLPDSSGRRIEAILTERGRKISAGAVVLTTGTFMEGKLFIGPWRASGGRLGEGAALGLGIALRARGFPVGRMKTGTPARVKAPSLDFDEMERQEGDAEVLPFSFIDGVKERPRLPCWITWTNERTHAVIRSGLDQSPLFSGAIVGKGPRYCPSIEDKVLRFPERPGHQIFVEPEGLDTDEMYLNGLSSSLPEAIQIEFIHTLPGFAHAEVVRPGYAVEYDYIAPTSLKASLESRLMAGLFVAGQTNGTSGYEEAAAQGIVAGINASAFLRGDPPLVLGREESYIGVLIDDIVTLGPTEPYRMFTSRAERRLSLRHDTADRRLTPLGRKVGLAGDERWRLWLEKAAGMDRIATLLSSRRITRLEAESDPALIPHIGEIVAAALRDNAVSGGFSRFFPEYAGAYPSAWIETAELDARYAGYEAKEERLAARFEKADRMRIPESFDFSSVEGLSKEATEKLQGLRPATLGQAARIPGVRRSDSALLMVTLIRGERKSDGTA